MLSFTGEHDRKRSAEGLSAKYRSECTGTHTRHYAFHSKHMVIVFSTRDFCSPCYVVAFYPVLSLCRCSHGFNRNFFLPSLLYIVLQLFRIRTVISIYSIYNTDTQFTKHEESAVLSLHPALDRCVHAILPSRMKINNTVLCSLKSMLSIQYSFGCRFVQTSKAFFALDSFHIEFIIYTATRGLRNRIFVILKYKVNLMVPVHQNTTFEH